MCLNQKPIGRDQECQVVLAWFTQISCENEYNVSIANIGHVPANIEACLSHVSLAGV